MTNKHVGYLKNKMKCLHTCCLCLKYCSQFILAGIGGSLFVYKNEIFIYKRRIFKGQNIHNIENKENTIVIYGGKQFACGTLRDGDLDIRLVNHIDDWIHGTLILDRHLGFVTAHNVVHIWPVENSKKTLTSQCSEKCILYSCNILGSHVNDLIVLAGTVFSEIIIWAPDFSLEGSSKILHRLSGPKGVIFSISVNDLKTMIVATSDDRSVCIWSVKSDMKSSFADYWVNAEITLTNCIFGHTSRVWKCLAMDSWIISIGEDSRLCVWSTQGQLEKVFKLHQESGIRGIDYSKEDGVVVTGGEDGSILTLKFPVNKDKTTFLALNNLVAGVAHKVMYWGHRIVTCTDQGSIVLVEENDTSKVIYENKEFSNYCVLAPSPCKKYLALGSLKGHLVILSDNYDVKFDKNMIDKQILSIHYLNQHLILTVADGLVLHYDVSYGANLIQIIDSDTFVLPKSKERWTTCALVIDNHLVVGDRMGSVFVYSILSAYATPVQSFFKIHGYLGVSDMVRCEGRILTSGRDGTIKYFLINTEGIQYLTSHKAPFPWIWKIIVTPADTLVFGFSSTNFMVWSLDKREVVAEYECGGGHRSCDVRYVDGYLHFVFIKDKVIQKVHLDVDRLRAVRVGFHSKTINCGQLVRADPPAIVSGGEDTTLRITSVFGEDVKDLLVLGKHISSVRAVCICEVSDTERLVVAAGGRAQITVWMFDMETSYCREVAEDLLFKDKTTDWRSAEVRFDPETRYMCVDAIVMIDSEVLIAAGCSDCHIRLFTYDGRLQLTRCWSSTHCILKVRLVLVQDRILVLSMSTSGRIDIWDVFGAHLGSHIIHQSGINSHDLVPLQDGRFVMVTGGDDNKLAVHILNLRKNEEGLSTVWSSSSAHACQITGVALLAQTMISTSIDQRVTLWRWAVTSTDRVAVDFLSQHMTDVADVQGLIVVRPSSPLTVCVYGRGVQLMTLDDNDDK